MPPGIKGSSEPTWYQLCVPNKVANFKFYRFYPFQNKGGMSANIFCISVTELHELQSRKQLLTQLRAATLDLEQHRETDSLKKYLVVVIHSTTSTGKISIV